MYFSFNGHLCCHQRWHQCTLMGVVYNTVLTVILHSHQLTLMAQRGKVWQHEGLPCVQQRPVLMSHALRFGVSRSVESNLHIFTWRNKGPKASSQAQSTPSHQTPLEASKGNIAQLTNSLVQQKPQLAWNRMDSSACTRVGSIQAVVTAINGNKGCTG